MIKFKNLFIIIIFLQICINYNGFVYCYTIDEYPVLRGYKEGGNIISIRCNDFPSTPIVTVTSVDGSETVRFPLRSPPFIDYYEWTVPEMPSGDSRKRKKSGSLRFLMKIDDFDVVIDSLFQYVEPTIRSFDPQFYYIGASGMKLIISGNNLILNPGDNPVVHVGREVCAVTQKSSNEIHCTLPVYYKPANVMISINLYRTTVESDSAFSYVRPIVSSIYPDHSAYGASGSIAIQGDIIDIEGFPTSTVKIGGMDCTNIKYSSSTKELTCDIPNIYVKEGTYEHHKVEVTTNGFEIGCDKQFTFYHPVIRNIDPDCGFAKGETEIRVTGDFFKDLAEVYIGDVQCSILKKDDSEFYCKAPPYDLGFETNKELQFKVNIGGSIFAPISNFIYYDLVIKNVEPNVIPLGVSKITITGDGFLGSGLSVKIGSETVSSFIETDTPNILYATVDTTAVGVGSRALTVQSSEGITPEVQVEIVQPDVASINMERGFVHFFTEIEIETTSIPILDTDYPESYVSFKINGQYCLNLKITNDQKFKCLVPPGDSANVFPIEIDLNGEFYSSTTRFTYFEPTVTRQSQTTTISAGGGDLVIEGEDLDVVRSIKIDNQLTIDISSCIQGSTAITCTIPGYKPGSFRVDLIVTDGHSVSIYSTNTDIIYNGPYVSSVVPSQGSKVKVQTLTITGTGFGIDANLLIVTIGAQVCTVENLISGVDQIVCSIPPIDPGTHHVVVNKKANLLDATGVNSNDQVNYISNSLSCLGIPNADGTNSPVDWWFIYKLSSSLGGDTNSYLYFDANSERLERYTNLQDHGMTNLSPIESTFMQYQDYNYLFFNDQTATRDIDGSRKNKADKHDGHVKGIVMFEDLDAVNNINGIHIHHSNPAFPSYKSVARNSYNEPSDGIMFLGAPDNNQHFFCHSFADFNQIMEYVAKVDGTLLSYVYRVPLINIWTTALKDRYHYFYDYMSKYITLTARTGPIPVMNQANYVTACNAIITTTNLLENVCWWRSGPILVGNTRVKYFMKTSIKKPNPKFVTLIQPRPVAYSKFLLAGSTKYDGLDIWMIVADCLQKKMFTEAYLGIAMSSKQMIPTEQVINVCNMELPQNLLVTPNKFQIKTHSNEHAKIGFPIYPNFQDPFGIDENYFCVGDSNRHTGQGGRGGGAICFQSPTLVYQFNRMVNSYYTYSSTNVILKKESCIELFKTVTQDIKIDRPNLWMNLITVEVKDNVFGNQYSKYPRDLQRIGFSTVASLTDITLQLQALRNSRTNVASTDGEISVVPTTGATVPQTDLLNYVSDDLFSIHYVAYDENIGAICKFVNPMTECNINNARSEIIPRTFPVIIPDFPSVYKEIYGNALAARRYDIRSNPDFKLMEFINQFKLLLPNAKKNFYPIFIDSSVIESNFYTGLGIRIRDAAVCYEEIAYLMTLQYIYYQSGILDNNLIYTTGTNNPNWANGIILAISKKLYNGMIIGTNAGFDGCMDNLVQDFSNIDTYSDNRNMDNPSVLTMFKRSAAAAWDWMQDSYSDGKILSLKRLDNSQIIPVDVLLDVMTKVKDSDGPFTDMSNLRRYFRKNLATNINFFDILYNNYIISNPDVTNLMVVDLVLPSSFRYQLKSNIETVIKQDPLLYQETKIASGVQQLLAILNGSDLVMDKSNLILLTPYQMARLELAMDKWLTVKNQSRAINTLILDPVNQLHDQPIRFIDELNRDQNENKIDLDIKIITSELSKLSLSSPLSIASITFILESIIVGFNPASIKHGDFELFYFPKSDGYNGYISDSYDGMVIATLNSQLCDVAMISEIDFLTNQYDLLCDEVGPIITSVNQLHGSTNGDYCITLNGIRFNSTMSVSIGDYQCVETLLISSTQISCLVPSGFGKNLEISISTDYSIYNIQRTKFHFSYDQPTINSVEPDIVDSVGGDILTIYGANFGSDTSNAFVFIDDRLKCEPIYSISHEYIACQVPSAVGEFRSLSVSVGGQSSTFNIGNIESCTIGYSGPNIIGIIPGSGDPLDPIKILGYGLGSTNDSDLPPILMIGDSFVPIENYTDNSINFILDYETLTQPLSIQVGDQSFSSEFEYLSPVFSQTNSSILNTTGGLIQLEGYGLGLYSSDIIALFKGKEIDCNAFNEFLECEIPPGLGKNYQVTISISDQPVEINKTVSYQPPTLTSYTINDENKIQLFGNNFVPAGVSYTSETSYIKLMINNQVNEMCSTFINDHLIECEFTDMPTSIQVVIVGQRSNILFLN